MKVMFVFMLKLLRHFVPPPSSPARGEVPRRGGWGGRTEEELVLHPKDGELLSSPSVYRGSTAKPGGS